MTWQQTTTILGNLPGVATLVKGVWNEIVRVTPDGVWVRSDLTLNDRFIPKRHVLHPHGVSTNGCVVRALGRAIGTY